MYGIGRFCRMLSCIVCCSCWNWVVMWFLNVVMVVVGKVSLFRLLVLWCCWWGVLFVGGVGVILLFLCILSYLFFLLVFLEVVLFFFVVVNVEYFGFFLLLLVFILRLLLFFVFLFLGVGSVFVRLSVLLILLWREMLLWECVCDLKWLMVWMVVGDLVIFVVVRFDSVCSVEFVLCEVRRWMMFGWFLRDVMCNVVYLVLFCMLGFVLWVKRLVIKWWRLR